jgi:predicted  nucleic acid-binding Zn-ribbon protein
MRWSNRRITMTPEEQAAADAAAAAQAATDAAAKQQKDPAYLESELKKAIAKRDALAAQVKELTPAAAKLKEIEDAAKSDVQRLTDELAALKPKATRTDALEAQVQGILDDATKGLTPEQKAAIVGDTPEARLAHFRVLQAAGMLGAAKKTASGGGTLPAEGNGISVTQAQVAAMTTAQRKALYADVEAGKRTVIPG